MYKVLIVDDEALTRRALSSIISAAEDMEVAALAESGEEAVEFCRDKDVDIVFMDIALPGMTGIEAAGMISRISPTSQIYIISALSGFDIIKRALSSKIRDYLVKPVSFSEVRNILDAYRRDQKEDQDFSARLLGFIHERQYRAMMKDLPAIVHDVFQESRGNKDRILARFLQIVNHIFSDASMYIYEDTSFSMDSFLERFPINRVFAEEEISWVFWFTEVVNSIYWQQIIGKHEYLQKVEEYIDSEIKNDISLSSICEACTISQSYLSKLVRRYFGISVMDYVHLRKINKAKMYIVLTDYTMTQIGHHTGYNDGSYFSKIFKKYEGMTPKQYKAAYSAGGRKEEKTN